MFKKILSAALTLSMLLTNVNIITAFAAEESYGFEKNEDSWTLQASNGRTSTGYDRYIFRSGERSYMFLGKTSTSEQSEDSSISKTIKLKNSGAYKVGVWYNLSEDYKRLDAKSGGAYFSYVLLDKDGREIPDSKYEYYISAPRYSDEHSYDAIWRGCDFYIKATDKTAGVRIAVGLKSSTGQVNFDDITIEEIENSNLLANPKTENQNTTPNARDSYFYSWESNEENWWRTTLGKTAVAEVGISDEEAHSGTKSFMFRATEMNVTAENNQQIINNNYNNSYFRLNPGVYDISWWYKIIGPYKRASNSWGMSVNVIVYGDDGSTKMGEVSKTYLDSDADKEWQKTSNSITVPEGASFVRINIGLRASTGTFFVDDLSITPLVSDIVTEPDTENYHGMTVRKLDEDSIFVNIDTKKALSDDVIDSVILGNEESESAHSLEPGKSVVGYGGLGDTYRQVAPGDDCIWVKLKVDPDKMNYITVKLWGSESENKEIKNLMLNDEFGSIQAKYGSVWPVWDNMYEEPAQIGAYFYATYRLPMVMTHGRTEVKFKIYHGGDANTYSANGMSAAMEYSRQLYKLVCHTDPSYKKMADDKESTTKRYDLGAIKVSPNGLSPYDYIINEMNAGVEKIMESQNYGEKWDEAVASGKSPSGAYGAVLEGTNTMIHGTWENWKNVHYVKCIGSNSESQKGIRAMAMAYNREWSNYYHDSEIIDRCVAWLDYQVRSQGSNGGWNNEIYKTWIGGPNRIEANGGINAGTRAVGEVFTEIGEEIIKSGYLEEYIDDDLNPDTPKVMRGSAYANMYKMASDYMFNQVQRKPAVNQELFNVVSGVAFEEALRMINPSLCMEHDKLLKRIYEASGIMRTPRESILISPKGLSMETIGHFDGAYDGNYGPHGAAMVADLAYITGDELLKEKAVNASHAMNYFADTVINKSGFNAIRREFNINTRNYKGPGRVEYAAWNNFIAAGFGSKDSIRSMELFVEYGELYLSSLVSDRRLLYYMIMNFDAMGERIKNASEGYKTFTDIKGIEQEAAIVTLAWKGIISGVNDTNFAPNEKIDEQTFKLWLKSAFGNENQIKYNSVMSRAQAVNEIYYALLDNGIYINKFDLGSGIYLPNEPWNKDKNGNQMEYVFSDEIAQSFSFQHKGEFVRGTLNWRSTINSFYYAQNHREHAINSQVFRWHEMNDSWSSHGSGYMAAPLGLMRVNVCKYGNYIIIMNNSDQNKSCNVELGADVGKIHDLVSDTMMDVNKNITMNACSTIIFDLRETESK